MVRIESKIVITGKAADLLVQAMKSLNQAELFQPVSEIAGLIEFKSEFYKAELPIDDREAD